MNLTPLNSFWTKLTFRFFLLKSAYAKQAIERMAAESHFGRCEVLQRGVEFDLRLAKPLMGTGRAAPIDGDTAQCAPSCSAAALAKIASSSVSLATSSFGKSSMKR
jgi:hypothetical protein